MIFKTKLNIVIAFAFLSCATHSAWAMKRPRHELERGTNRASSSAKEAKCLSEELSEPIQIKTLKKLAKKALVKYFKRIPGTLAAAYPRLPVELRIECNQHSHKKDSSLLHKLFDPQDIKAFIKLAIESNQIPTTKTHNNENNNNNDENSATEYSIVPNWHTALYSRLIQRQPAIADTLLDVAQQIEKEQLAQEEEEGMVKFNAACLIDNVLNPNNNHPLLLALLNGYKKIAEKIITIVGNNPDQLSNYLNKPNKSGQNPLIAAIVNVPRLVPLLIKNGAEVDFNHLKAIAQTDDPLLFKQLHQANFDFDQSALYIPDINEIDEPCNSEFTCLMLAVMHKPKNITRLVREGKADVNACADSESPLSFAAKTYNISAIKKLIKEGANLNEEQSTGGTVLSFILEQYIEDTSADSETLLKIIKLLLRKGITISAYDKEVVQADQKLSDLLQEYYQKQELERLEKNQ